MSLWPLWLVGSPWLSDIQPIRSLVRLAGVNVHHLLAVGALHGAAPLELAFALGDALDAHGVVAPPTAHDLAAVQASGGLVAHSACRAQGSWKDICVKEGRIINFPEAKIQKLLIVL